MVIHELKIHPAHFKAVIQGNKTFELRFNDRNFQVRDYLRLREYNPETKEYTHQCIGKRISHILHGPYAGLEEGYVILSLE